MSEIFHLGSNQQVQIYPQPIEQIPTLDEWLESLSSPIDSFNEWFIRTAEFYVIADHVSGQVFGHAAIHEKMGLTQFYQQATMRRYSQPLFRALRDHFEFIQAMVPTCDEFFLSHALDDYMELHKQAYFFVAGADLHPWNDIDGLEFRQATAQDYANAAEVNGDFLDKLEKRIMDGEIHIGRFGSKIVAIGIIELGHLLPDCGSIGMLVAPEQRQKGIGTRMLRYLRNVCAQNQLRPIAGCGYDNHLSKRTLEAAGMVTATRLLRIKFKTT